MPHSPRTPTRPRLAAGLEYASPQSNGPSPQSDSYSSPRPFQTHRTSLYSIPSPSTSQPTSSHDRGCSFGMTNGFGGVPNEDDGLGNLADELAEAWDEDIHGEPEEEELRDQVDGTALVHDGQLDLSKKLGDSSDINTTAELMAPSIWAISSDPSSPTKRRSRPKHHRQFSRDGEFDHSNNSSADANINSPLIAQMTSIETLACEGLESNGNGEDSIIERFANSLKDLGSQTGLENGATRLITAHAALAAHFTHQARVIQTISPRIYSPLSLVPDSAVIDPLLPLLSSLTLALPSPNPQPLRSLLHLHASTSDLLSTISALSDTLHMTRQTASVASRRLKAARETFEELKRDAQVWEDGVKWVADGQWNERLAGRECARECQDIIRGFEEVCSGWREKLAGGGIGGPGMQVCAG